MNEWSGARRCEAVRGGASKEKRSEQGMEWASG